MCTGTMSLIIVTHRFVAQCWFVLTAAVLLAEVLWQWLVLSERRFGGFGGPVLAGGGSN